MSCKPATLTKIGLILNNGVLGNGAAKLVAKGKNIYSSQTSFTVYIIPKNIVNQYQYMLMNLL